MKKTAQILTLAISFILVSPVFALNSSLNSAFESALPLENREAFPAHWWKAVPRSEAKHWEILPQDAKENEVVLSKRNELGILSNFADASFVLDGVCYPTVEGFWQMMKFPEGNQDPRWHWATPWAYTRYHVSQMNGYAAKSAGSYANYLMSDFNSNTITYQGQELIFAQKTPGAHYALILRALTEKLRQNKEVREILLKTSHLILKADHGISENSPREWHYNLLWMDLRKTLQEGTLDLNSAEDLSLKTCESLKG